MRADITDTQPIPVITSTLYPPGTIVAVALPPSYVGRRLWSASAGRHARRGSWRRRLARYWDWS